MSGLPYGLGRAARTDQGRADNILLGGNLGQNFDGLILGQGVVLAKGAFIEEISFLDGCQVMTALEATDVIAVNISIFAQVSVTPGAALEPKHLVTSSVALPLI
ncbi:MAG: hypothetical protein CL902_10410 [Dehalococcoidia bacterium]|nr:hypothetical protein [Dehalococcoidia bacterium]|tara:strand:+ start:372 stop:683 length:312 start_codon:yes stop_codon:yes gene_type:complete